MNKKFKKIGIVILALVIVQIILIISITFSFSYIVNQISSDNVQIQVESDEFLFKDLLEVGVNLLISFFSIKQIGSVSAQGIYCCPEVKDQFGGGVCQPMSGEETVQCKTNPAPGSCDNLGTCRPGCCIDQDQGICTSNSPQGECSGTWKNDDACSYPECQKGCCMLKDGPRFLTNRLCDSLSESQGLQKDFRNVENEISCFALGQSNIEGACVFENGNCERTTGPDCVSRRGVFASGYLCTHSDLNTTCRSQDHLGCIDGKDEIYWFDSCGNKENIYQSSSTGGSWNNGQILSKNEACNSNSPNGNTNNVNCGNCDRSLGSTCSISNSPKVRDGNFICKDLRCWDDFNNKWRNNGESWCVYEGKIGEGRDVVGSEHWMTWCLDGEIKEPYVLCGSQRKGICTESTVKEGKKSFSVASCVPNEASRCLFMNPLQYQIGEDEDAKIVDNATAIEICEENTHCYVNNIAIDNNYKFKLCLPSYPAGAELKDEVDDNVCSMATQTCTIVYEKKNAFDDYDCKYNCDCKRKEFVEKMNEFCYSLGDCGSYVNYVGEGTDNIYVAGDNVVAYGEMCNAMNVCNDCEGTPFKGVSLFCSSYLDFCENHGSCSGGTFVLPSYSKLKWDAYASNANDERGQRVEPQDIRRILGMMLGEDFANLDPSSPEYTTKVFDLISEISGGIGTLAFGLAATTSLSLTAPALSGEIGLMLYEAGLPGAASATVLGAVSFAATGAALGLFLGGILVNVLGIQGWGATLAMIGVGLAGAFAGLAVIGVSIPGVGTAVAIFGAIVLAIFGALFGKKYKEKTTTFVCSPWQPPIGGDDCQKCNEDPNMPCTKYRCEALGLGCILLNEGGVENPLCESLPKESAPPIITPLATDEYSEFQNNRSASVDVRTKAGNCLSEFTPVTLIFETDEPAQCKWAPEYSFYNFTGMPSNWPLQGSSYSYNHTFIFSMPSVSSLESEQVSGNIKQWFGDFDYYLSCKDYWNNTNIEAYSINFCIHSGPDQTAVDHRYTTVSPPSDSKFRVGTEEVGFNMWINEPAQCRYGTTNGAYNALPNNLSCVTNINAREPFGYKCAGTLKNLQEGDNQFFIKCKDQPWLPIENDSQRNINDNAYRYNIKVSREELKIRSLSFEHEELVKSSGAVFKDGFEPMSITMSVSTQGGIDNGQSKCYWGVLEEGDKWLFYNTNSNVHTQVLSPRYSGIHKNYIECVDGAGNTASISGNFTLELDTSSPKIIRVYKEGSWLKIVTDEEAKCYYHPTKCVFSFDEAQQISSEFTTEHLTSWNTNIVYNINCEDAWGRSSGSCILSVSPADLG